MGSPPALAAPARHSSRNLAGMTYHQLDGHEARAVEVQLDDGIWAPGFLEAYRKVEGVWSGFVRYTLAAEQTHLGWFEEGRIRGHA